MEPNRITGRSLALWGGTALIVAVIAIIATKVAGPSDDTQNGVSATLEPVSKSDWIKGDSSAPVTLIEYSDFQCPACAAYFPLIEQVTSAYPKTVALVYRHFPLQQHRQAKIAAYAAEAAGEQGKFWEMYSVLFEKQDQWAGKTNAAEIFETYAKDLSLDIERFKVDVARDEIQERVNEDYRNGLTAKVNATPTFFLNGKKIQNPTSLEAFQKLIDAALSTTT